MEEDPLNVRLGRNLAKHRKFMALTQEQFALRLGVEPETISRFERGATLPSLNTLEKIADLLQVRVADLLDERSPLSGNVALMVQAWLAPLSDADRNFVVENMKMMCHHLQKNSKK